MTARVRAPRSGEHAARLSRPTRSTRAGQAHLVPGVSAACRSKVLPVRFELSGVNGGGSRWPRRRVVARSLPCACNARGEGGHGALGSPGLSRLRQVRCTRFEVGLPKQERNRVHRFSLGAFGQTSPRCLVTVTHPAILLLGGRTPLVGPILSLGTRTPLAGVSHACAEYASAPRSCFPPAVPRYGAARRYAAKDPPLPCL